MMTYTVTFIRESGEQVTREFSRKSDAFATAWSLVAAGIVKNVNVYRNGVQIG